MYSVPLLGSMCEILSSPQDGLDASAISPKIKSRVRFWSDSTRATFQEILRAHGKGIRILDTQTHVFAPLDILEGLLVEAARVTPETIKRERPLNTGSRLPDDCLLRRLRACTPSTHEVCSLS